MDTLKSMATAFPALLAAQNAIIKLHAHYVHQDFILMDYSVEAALTLVSVSHARAPMLAPPVS